MKSPREGKGVRKEKVSGTYSEGNKADQVPEAFSAFTLPLSPIFSRQTPTMAPACPTRAAERPCYAARPLPYAPAGACPEASGRRPNSPGIAPRNGRICCVQTARNGYRHRGKRTGPTAPQASPAPACSARRTPDRVRGRKRCQEPIRREIRLIRFPTPFPPFLCRFPRFSPGRHLLWRPLVQLAPRKDHVTTHGLFRMRRQTLAQKHLAGVPTLLILPHVMGRYAVLEEQGMVINVGVNEHAGRRRGRSRQRLLAQGVGRLIESAPVQPTRRLVDRLPTLGLALPRLHQQGQAVPFRQAQDAQAVKREKDFLNVAAHRGTLAVAGLGLLSPSAGPRGAGKGLRQVVVGTRQVKTVRAFDGSRFNSCSNTSASHSQRGCQPGGRLPPSPWSRMTRLSSSTAGAARSQVAYSCTTPS